MTKSVILVIFFTVCLLLMLFGCTQPAPAPAPVPTPTPSPAPVPTPPFEPVTWQLAGSSPAVLTHPAAATYMELAEVISQRTGGKLTLEYHQQKELGLKGTEMMALIGSGAVKAGEVMGNYHEGTEPLLAIEGLPFLGTTEDIPTKLNILRPYAEEILDRQNIKILLNHNYPSLLWENNQINNLDDLEGLKIRCTAAAPAECLRNLGASALPMPAGDIYQSLATGILTGTTFSATGGMGRSFHEVTKYLYLSPAISGQASYTVINKDAFNSLPADVQKVLVDTCKEYEPIMIDNVRYLLPEDRAVLESKMTVIDNLNPQLVEQMINQGGYPTWDQWIAEHPEAEPVLNEIKSALGLS
ncbi:TRAP transporter substrate-binding protein DctP [Chloroflexota bacterium]